jgi:hypothetical protein
MCGIEDGKEVKSEGESGVSTLLFQENDKHKLNIILSMRKRREEPFFTFTFHYFAADT